MITAAIRGTEYAWNVESASSWCVQTCLAPVWQLQCTAPNVLCLPGATPHTLVFRVLRHCTSCITAPAPARHAALMHRHYTWQLLGGT